MSLKTLIRLAGSLALAGILLVGCSGSNGSNGAAGAAGFAGVAGAAGGGAFSVTCAVLACPCLYRCSSR